MGGEGKDGQVSIDLMRTSKQMKKKYGRDGGKVMKRREGKVIYKRSRRTKKVKAIKRHTEDNTTNKHRARRTEPETIQE